ncbi:MAG: Chromate resistance protein ChrB [Gemmatimonadales bacterium]
MPSPRWVLLSSRLPHAPSRLRLGVWRRLRRLGAVLLHDAVWVLPASAETREAFEWLAEEIAEQGGTAFVWEATSLDQPQNRDLVRRFRAEADARYAALAQSARDLARAARRCRSRAAPDERSAALRQLRGLERALHLERRRDYFRAAGRAKASSAVTAALSALDVKRPAARAPGDDHALDHPAASAH